MRRHLRVAALVGIGFGLILVAAVLGSTPWPSPGVARPAGLLLGVLGFVIFLASGLWYTVLFVREFVRPSE